jgi:predicted nucleotidyltransferase
MTIADWKWVQAILAWNRTEQAGGNYGWVPGRTIYVTRHGSHAYGTNLPTSDDDLRGLCVPPREFYLGFQEFPPERKNFEQLEMREPLDIVLWELRKFIGLAAESNPNTIEILFTDSRDHLFVHPVMEKLLAARELFLCRQLKHSFSGYARSQLHRIEGHYRWLKNPPAGPPTRAEFGLRENPDIPSGQLQAVQAAIRKQMDQWAWHEMEILPPPLRQAMQDEFTRRLLEITKWDSSEVTERVWLAAAQTVGLDTNFIEMISKERRYGAKLADWNSYLKWKAERNEARAHLEAQFGYDTKHAMHLVRLMRMAREIITTGQVLVRRPDAEELLAIRAGAWPIEKLMEYATTMDADLNELVKTSKLPATPDRAALNKVCIEMIEGML